MFAACVQKYEFDSAELPSIIPLQCPSTSTNLNDILNLVAKNYIVCEQGTRRAEEPIRSLKELESEKHKLEKGYYLVNSQSTNNQLIDIAFIDVYELFIEKDGLVFAGARTLKKMKKIAVWKSNSEEQKYETAPITKKREEDWVNVQHTTKLEQKVNASTNILQLTPSILALKLSSLRKTSKNY
jgi:ribosomal silencing factor RsfS